MMTTGVVPGRVVSRIGVRLEVMAVVEGEVFDDPIDDVVPRRCVRPQASRQAPEERKQLTGQNVRGGRQLPHRDARDETGALAFARGRTDAGTQRRQRRDLAAA